MRRTFVVLLLLAGASAVAALAQTDTGSISGVVGDTTGAVIPGARIVITQVETNVRVELDSTAPGFYLAPALRPGHYDVELSKDGFQAQRKTGAEVRVQDRLELNFTLALGTTSSEVTVTGEAQRKLLKRLSIRTE